MYTHTHRVLLRYGCVNIYTNVVQSFYGLQHFTSRKSVHLHENLCSHLYIYIYIYYWGAWLKIYRVSNKKKLPNKTILLGEVIYSPYKPKYIFLTEKYDYSYRYPTRKTNQLGGVTYSLYKPKYLLFTNQCGHNSTIHLLVMSFARDTFVFHSALKRHQF